MKYASVPTDQLQPWAVLNDVELRGVKISPAIITDDGVDKGGGLLSTTEHESEDILLSIPKDLILCKENVLQSAKTDKHLREVTEVLSDFIQVGPIIGEPMLFLLLRFVSDSKKSYHCLPLVPNDHLKP